MRVPLPWFLAAFLASPVFGQVGNDDCATAQPVVHGFHSISTVGATGGGSTGQCAGGAMANDVWFRYVAPVSGYVGFRFCEADFDAMIEVYPDGCSGASAIDCSASTCQAGAMVGLRLALDDACMIRVGSMTEGQSGTGTLVVLDAREGPLGRPICLGEPNVTGQRGVLRAFGSLIPSYDDLTLRAMSLPSGALTLFLASSQPDVTVMPGGSIGTLCLGGPVARFVSVAGNAHGGLYTREIDTTRIPMPPTFHVGIQPFDTWYFQAWYRDVSQGIPTSNFTSAIEVTYITD
ncbi:MAG: hypothetical protein AAGG01_07190 [Planctomycetota bacterium]